MNKNKAEELDLEQEAPQEQMALDDTRRVKVLSPGMLVFKRFIRNKLAVAGIVILVIMFTFSFLGPLFSSYGLEDRFFKYKPEEVSYATAKTKDVWFTGEIEDTVRTGALREIGLQKFMDVYQLQPGQEFSFEDNGEQYTVRVINADPYTPTIAVYGSTEIAHIRRSGNQFYDPTVVDEGLLSVIRNHAESKSMETTLKYDGMDITVQISMAERKYFIASDSPIAVASFNRYTPVNGKVMDLQSDAKFMHDASVALMSGASSFEYEGRSYILETEDVDHHILKSADGATLFNVVRDFRYGKVEVASEDKNTKELLSFTTTISSESAFRAAVNAALDAGEHSFSFEEKTYSIESNDEYGSENNEEEMTQILVNGPDNEQVLSIANRFDAAPTKYDNYNENVEFVLALEEAIANRNTIFMYEDERFQWSSEGDDYAVYNPNGVQMLLVSKIHYGAENSGTVLTIDFIKKMSEAVRNKLNSFVFVDQYGVETKASIEVNNQNYYVKTLQDNKLVDSRADISSEHLLGTDMYGQDVLTRLMYGGRVSLLVGFVVVFFELIIGVLIGGFSGYFGGVTDTILMRFVELFNCIPFFPMLLILGSLMDAEKISNTPRLILTMVILGLLGWTGIARIVRGQILSLREQDFMIATEATGIRTSRRIFKHLVPNVMPLLIVNATQGLGEIILTEATLGFLGLGVKYPMASWGSIVNQATDLYVMSAAWWIWIPAGLLILTTVLGFNFVGDGLRDAFDPKMKR